MTTETETKTERTLDWRPFHDPRSRLYPVRTVLDETIDFSRPKFWTGAKHRIDQGAEGACVGFGWTGEAMASPKPVKIGAGTKAAAEKYALKLYNRAQEYDRAQGYTWDSGASVIAGAKAFVEFGLADGYRWAFGIDDVIAALCSSFKNGGGPVVLGIPWYESMYETFPNALMNVERHSRMVGGHCIIATGWHPHMRFSGFDHGGWRFNEVIRLRNSWGPDYGKNGDAYISPEDLEWLLNQNGEACVPVGRHTPKIN